MDSTHQGMEWNGMNITDFEAPRVPSRTHDHSKLLQYPCSHSRRGQQLEDQ